MPNSTSITYLEIGDVIIHTIHALSLNVLQVIVRIHASYIKIHNLAVRIIYKVCDSKLIDGLTVILKNNISICINSWNTN